MTLSVWRQAHFLLAIVSCLFLFVASATGVILAVDAVNEKNQPYKVENFQDITLAQSLPELKKKYPELLSIRVDHNQFVTAEGFDEEGNDFNAYIHPLTGEILGHPQAKSNFIQWNLALHRSLFIHETGRFIVGVISFLLMLIVVSGTMLIIKRQQGLRHFFDKMTRDFFAQYYHVVAGRLLLIPIFIIALTGTYLFLARFDIIGHQQATATTINAADTTEKTLATFPLFNQLKLAEIVKIDFPLDDDPEEYFKLKLKDKELTVNQVNGTVIEEARYPMVEVWETLSLDLHTGRTNSIWAIVLGIASLNIIFFIYSGFAITLRRKAVKTRNKFKPEEAEFILLVGSENGSTLGFANQVHNQLLSLGKKSFITALNQYQTYPNAGQLLVFTSTFGLGDAPSNASHFERLLAKYPQTGSVQFSVIGFGSRTYEDYCGFAILADNWLAAQPWAVRSLELHTVNDKSKEDFVHWVKAWSERTSLNLTTSTALYGGKAPALRKMKVSAKTSVSEQNPNFSVLLTPGSRQKFRSGDLLAIYPANDDRERLYSIARQNNSIQLIVKLHEFGLGSQFLHQLSQDQVIKARIIQNPSFHFPSKAPQVAMIANGTGIAPFLGMIEENKHRINLRLYAGFRHETDSTREYRAFAHRQIEQKHLHQFHIAFSREQQHWYVMDLIKRDAVFFATLLQQDGVLMICGSLAMQRDVETVLHDICEEMNGMPLSYYKTKGQLLADCY